MKDYASMSDVQVSKAVGDAIGIEWANLDDNYHELCYWPELDDEPRIFDPCNNPADAWPIIVENGITLAFQDGNWWADNLAYWVDGVEWNIGGIIDKNPLRCAMIVFLMMKEGE